MKKAMTAAAVAAIATLTAGIIPTAHAADAGVSRHQYNNVQVGETKAQVQKAFRDKGEAFSRGQNKYGVRVWKVYPNRIGSTVVVTYLRAAGSHRFVVIDAQWCTGTLTDGSLTCVR